MVNVMVSRVVVENPLKRVVGQPQATVVVDGLDGGEREEEDGRSRSHSRHQKGDSTANSVQQQAFQGMIVQRSEGEWHHQPVVLGVHVLVHKLVNVHPPVAEVLPGIHYEHGHHKLERRNP